MKRQRIEHSDKAGLDYVIWIPADDPGRRGWPLIIFLHGGAETGGHPSGAAMGGLPKQIERGLTLPYIVVSPHCPIPPQPNRHSWSEYADEVLAVVDDMVRMHRINETAIMLTGQSMGGFGTWDLGARHAARFSALAPVCGGGDPRQAATLAQLPICVIHGELDSVVPVQRSTEMIDAVRSHGGDVEVIMYADAGHVDTTERVYAAGSELYDWFESHTGQGRSELR